ncbi:nucleotide triphosphate diphosphatase NUDT15 [Acinetobacter shaoyimingii]|uniref:NUDIX hydrolase n=1 Tax=Acinetobacter shaoyimingii TaxID=2715164 RepID=A0A6G8RSQ8_9GAMM|nr:NUDIX hydrolase [Acinetobacter shaoyimingii]NHB56570.1 NUDIX hydrolase [Acinetobacter shaoyimingii]QIO04925.1 NUDIX hydrolase [Acinetobacter shaoyimingii]
MSINQFQNIIGVGIMLIDQNQKVLLGYRNKKDEPATWCFPGGKMDPHESIEYAAMRELLEETALDLSQDVASIKPLNTMIDKSSGAVKVTFGTIYQLSDERLKTQIYVTEPEIFERWEWFSINELPQILFPETEVMIKHYLNQPQDKNWKIYPIQSQ